MANIAAGVVDAVVNAGWWVANANRVRDIVNRGMDIAEDRSKDCIKIFQNAVDSMLQKGVEIVGEWNYVTKCAGISALAVCVNHLVNKLSDANCEEDYFAPKCFVKNSINVVATVIASVSLINMLMGKRTTDLNIDRSHSRQSSSEATVAGIGASGVDIKEIKLCGVKNNKPYFLVHKLFDKRKCIETQGSLKIRISLEARSFLLETPGLQLSEDTFFPHLTSV